MNMYSRSSANPVPTPGSTEFSYTGCYTEATQGRALAGKTTFADDMAVEKCAASCAGFSMFGLEYYREVRRSFISTYFLELIYDSAIAVTL